MEIASPKGDRIRARELARQECNRLLDSMQLIGKERETFFKVYMQAWEVSYNEQFTYS